MKPITAFDKSNLDGFRHEIQAALDAISEKHGLKSIKLGTIRFDQTQFKSTLEAKVKDELNPTAMGRNLEWSKMLGYNQNIVGEYCFFAGKRYKLTGIDGNKPKKPISIIGENGTTYVVAADKQIRFENPAITYEREKNVYADRSHFAGL